MTYATCQPQGAHAHGHGHTHPHPHHASAPPVPCQCAAGQLTREDVRQIVREMVFESGLQSAQGNTPGWHTRP
jgi:hypothetical protein